MTTIRSYRGADETALLDCWNRALPYDPLDAPTFRRKVLLDPNFDPAGLRVVKVGGVIAGFCLAMARRVPFEDVGLQSEQGWITAFGVAADHRRRGLGAALLTEAEAWLAAGGRTTVSLAPYLPHYFVPGVDERGYAEGLAWLLRRGYEVASRALSMDANLVLLDPAPAQELAAKLATRRIDVRHLRETEIPDLTAFLAQHMPGDWQRHARAVLTDTTRGLACLTQFSVAVAEGEIVGYCQHEGEHFGPFGVIAARQGQGIGTVLLAHCLQSMRQAGLHHAWVLWTSDHTAEHVYHRFGFRETRRFSVVRRELARG